MTALLVGGSSEIGLAVLKEILGPPPRRIVLAGRPSEELWTGAEELRECGYYVTTAQYDAALDADEIDGLLRHLTADQDLDLAVVAVGTMAEKSFADGLVVNGVAVSLLIRALVRRLRPPGQLVLLSSAAAVRPRHSIAAYSLGKQLADSTAVLLAPEAAAAGIRVLVVRPGFVRTRMTADLPQPPLATTPEKVALRVSRALRGRRVVVWAPGVMAIVVRGLRLVPSWLLPASLR